mgnify:CR=1 FL=1
MAAGKPPGRSTNNLHERAAGRSPANLPDGVAGRSIARVAPTFLTKQVFASAAGGDALLAADPQFRRQIAPLLRDSLTRGSAVYRADVSSYATTHIDAYLDQITSLTAPVTFWHGSMDNWAPVEMAAALAQRLPGATVHIEPGASHYSTLAAFLAQV